jgi:hypothetical protein
MVAGGERGTKRFSARGETRYLRAEETVYGQEPQNQPPCPIMQFLNCSAVVMHRLSQQAARYAENWVWS